jgi:solute carrier family 25 protein 38
MAANMQDRGIAGFFSGSSLRISRKAASSAIAWTVYEAVLIFIRDRNEEINSRDSKII